MKRPLRIGLVDQSAPGWSAGATFTEMLLHSLTAACAEAGDAEVVKAPRIAPSLLPGEQVMRERLGLGDKLVPLPGETRLRRALLWLDPGDVFSWAQQNRIEVLLPLFDLPPWDPRVRTIGWIPDFQHLHQPQFFTSAELQRREACGRRLAQRATRIMLSSQDAAGHFAAFAPAETDKVRVLPFPSLLAFSDEWGDTPTVSGQKFSLPEKFALVANQFWAHKNHECVIAAVAQLQRQGVRIPVVMTGLPADHRQPANDTVSRVLQTIAECGLSGQVVVLGLVTRLDLVTLMRTASVIIQPSRFEGWSTVVQDAIALGRPLLCSALAVHREQAPSALGFFDPATPSALAELLAQQWEGLRPGPGPEETAALEQEREAARAHGRQLLQWCRECAGR